MVREQESVDQVKSSNVLGRDGRSALAAFPGACSEPWGASRSVNATTHRHSHLLEHFSRGNPSEAYRIWWNHDDLNCRTCAKKTCVLCLRGRGRIHACSVSAKNLGTARLYPCSKNLRAARTHLGVSCYTGDLLSRVLSFTFLSMANC